VKTVEPEKTKLMGRIVTRPPDKRYLEQREDRYSGKDSERRDRARNAVVCFKCRRPGHIARFCDNNNQRAATCVPLSTTREKQDLVVKAEIQENVTTQI
jgi:hypothetical protein